MKRWNQRGDTLVEVLFALAIIGVVLGVAYSTAARSVRTGRLAQEQTEALKIAEAQLESIKTIASDTTTAATVFADPDNNFCVTGSPPATTNACTTGLYTTRDSYDTASSTFTVQVTWERQGGAASGEAEPRVVLTYRLYQ